MRRADVLRTYAVPLRVIPERGQVSEHSTEPSAPDRGDVLHEDVVGSKLPNDPSELGPKTRASVGESFASAGDTEALAGEAAADELDGGEIVGANVTYIDVSNSVRESRLKYGPAIGVELDLPRRLEARALEPEVEASNPGKERADAHVTPPPCAAATPRAGRA
jgi:hypothetical protein